MSSYDENHLAPPSAISPATLSRVTSASSTRSRARSPALSRTSSTQSAPLRPSPSPRASQSSLTTQAKLWRGLESVGAWVGSWPSPAPPEPSFLRHFFTTETPSATIELAFYVPARYQKETKQGRRYPVVVNFHGGGFTLGTAKDDARWAAFVLKEVDAVCVSVEYRLAPESPFPTAVEDGVESVLHLADNAEEYGIDPKRMALSGFSAGANLCFAIPLKLHEHTQSIQYQDAVKALDEGGSDCCLPEIVSIISWYPPLDMRISRADRRKASVRPDKTLPDMLTGLFDQSYLQDEESKSSPFASPSAASDEALTTALPNNIALYLCEWDMLMKEGKEFSERLQKLGKNVKTTLIKEKRHAFDKLPNPFSVDPKVALHYGQACDLLREAFKQEGPGSGALVTKNTYSLADAFTFEPGRLQRKQDPQSSEYSEDNNNTEYRTYLFSDACKETTTAEWDCNSNCEQDAFTSLYTIHNCAAASLLINVPANTSGLHNGYNITNPGQVTITTDTGTTDAGEIGRVLTQDPNATAITASDTIWNCLSKQCSTYPECNDTLSSLDIANKETPLLIRLYIENLVAALCSSLPPSYKRLNADVGGIGVYVSYWIHGSLALLCFIMSFFLKFMAPYIFQLKFRHSRRRKEAAKSLAQEHLSRLVAAMADFQKAQCFFMIAINIAAIKVSRQGGLDPQSLQQIYNNFLFLKLIAVSGYLPITFTLFNMHLVHMTSWYMITLSCLCTTFAIATLGVLGSFQPSEFDMLDLQTFATSTGPEHCGSKQPWVYCYETLGSSSSVDSGDVIMSEDANVDTMAWRILGFTLVVMLYLIASKSRLRHRPLVQRLSRWMLAETVSILAKTVSGGRTISQRSIDNGILQQIKAELSEARPVAREAISWIRQWMWLRTPNSVTARLRTIGNSKAWTTTMSYPRVTKKRFKPWLERALYVTRERVEEIGYARFCYKVYKFCIFVVFVGFYMDFFALFMSDLAWFAYKGIYNKTWNFGQVVALTVWAPPIAEYIHLEFRGVKRGFDHKLLPPYRITKRAMTFSSSTLDLERNTLQLTSKPRVESTDWSETRVDSARSSDDRHVYSETAQNDARSSHGSSDSGSIQETSPLKTSIDDTVWQLPEPQFPSRTLSLSGYDRL